MGVVRKKRSGKYEVRDGIQYIPDSQSPTGFREYCVTEAAWEARRKFIADRAGNRCECGCMMWCPFPAGDGAHIKSTGCGGDDAKSNLRWMSRFCHSLSHSPKAVPRKHR